MWEIPRIIGLSQMTSCFVQHGHSTVLKIDATARRCVCMCCGRAIVTFLLISPKPQRWSWNWIYHQKAHESSFPMIRLPNWNVVKFSHANQKHFTVGDLMAFQTVKMENKNPQNLPFPLHDVDSHQIQECLGQPHAPPQTAAPDGWGTVAHWRLKVPTGYNGALQVSPQKYPFPWTDPQTPLPASSLDPSDVRRQTASGSDRPFFHNALDRPTDARTYGPTDCPWESLTTKGRCTPRSMRPNNYSICSINLLTYLLTLISLMTVAPHLHYSGFNIKLDTV